MRVRFVVAICASMAVLAAMPAAAGACPSLARVKAFKGHAHTGFDAQASGLNEPGQPQYGTETIHLQRSAGNLDINLTHKTITRAGIVTFTGKAGGGDLTIEDTSTDSSDHTKDSVLHYNGPPHFAAATLFLDPKKCKYQLTVSFAIPTPDRTAVRGLAFSKRNTIPASRKLASSEYPDGYYTCPGDPLLSGSACYQFGGGFATDFMTLFQCHSAQAVNCSSKEGPVGLATFAWHLKPSYVKKK